MTSRNEIASVSSTRHGGADRQRAVGAAHLDDGELARIAAAWSHRVDDLTGSPQAGGNGQHNAAHR